MAQKCAYPVSIYAIPEHRIVVCPVSISDARPDPSVALTFAGRDQVVCIIVDHGGEVNVSDRT